MTMTRTRIALTLMALAAGIVVVLVVVFPVLVLMSGAVASGLLGFLLHRDVDEAHAGSELVELNT